MNDIPQILPEDLPGGHPYLILDVRELSEWNTVHIPGALHVPLGTLARRAPELPANREILCLCHHGIRSQRAAEYLAAKGFKVSNLLGGIERWALKKDPSLPRY